ncbi:calcium-binding protein 7 isoform 1-T1 [Sarcophilus harrisii]
MVTSLTFGGRDWGGGREGERKEGGRKEGRKEGRRIGEGRKERRKKGKRRRKEGKKERKEEKGRKEEEGRKEGRKKEKRGTKEERRGRGQGRKEEKKGDGQVDFEEFVTLLGPKLSTSGIPEKFHGTDFDTVFWKCDMQKLTVDELKRLLYDTFCEHLSMKDIENIIMTEEESHLGTPEECPVDVETCSNQQIRQTCVRKSLICAFAIAFIISVMLIAANQVLRSGTE